MTRSEIEKVARAVLGPDEDLRGLDERALMMVTVARRLGKLPLEQQGDAYLNEAFAKIAHSVSGLRRDETRRDDPKLDATPPALDPRVASVEQLAARATAAREAFRRDTEASYLGVQDVGGRTPERLTETRRDDEATSEAARSRMVSDAEGAWEAPEPRSAAKSDGGAGTAEAARRRMLAALVAAAGRGE